MPVNDSEQYQRLEDLVDELIFTVKYAEKPREWEEERAALLSAIKDLTSARSLSSESGTTATENATMRLLEINAYACQGATLVGNPAPAVKKLGDRMRSVRVGDMVMETSTIWHEDRVGTRIGRLLRVADEPVYTAQAWAENGGGDEPIPLEDVYYIGLPDGTEYRWRNASFIAIPDKLGGWHENWHSTGTPQSAVDEPSSASPPPFSAPNQTPLENSNYGVSAKDQTP